MKRRNNKNTAIDYWIFLDGPPQNAPRNPLVKYYTSWQSCLKRRRHLRPLSTLFLTLNRLTSAKWKHMSAFWSVYIWRILSIPRSPPSGLVSEHEQICRPKLRMRYRMSVIYGHPVMTATRALRFSDHVTKRNGGSGDENALGGTRFPWNFFVWRFSEIRWLMCDYNRSKQLKLNNRNFRLKNTWLCLTHFHY